MFDSGNQPELHFRHEVRGHGVIRLDDKEISAPAFTIRRPKYGAREGWDVRIHIDATYEERRAVLGDAESPSLIGESDIGRAVRIDELLIDHASTRRVQATCYELELGPEAYPDPPDAEGLSISFSDTSVAQREVPLPVATPDGEIKAKDGKEKEPFRISTTLGDAKFSLKYEWEKALVADNETRVPVPQPKLRLVVDGEETTERPFDLLRDLEHDLKWFERLLAFFSRKHVSWSRAYIEPHWEYDLPVDSPPESERWRAGAVGDPSTQVVERPFINPSRMESHDLDYLLQSLRDLGYAESVYHAIGYLIGTVSYRFIEGQMMSAFTAFEALVSGWCRYHNVEFIIESDPHKEIAGRVKNELKDAIRDHPDIIEASEAEDSKEGVYDALRRKMAESHTRRRSFADRAQDTVEGSGVGWKDLWPEDTALRTAISRAYSRRSKLIHEGKRPDDPPSWVDIFRIHALSERIIYNLIGGEERWLSPGAYSHCARLREFSA